MPKRSVTQTMLEECRPFDEDYWCVCVCVKEREKERERLCACMPKKEGTLRWRPPHLPSFKGPRAMSVWEAP